MYLNKWGKDFQLLDETEDDKLCLGLVKNF
jgi:hypothetical protein